MKTYKYEIFTKVFEKNIREGFFQPGHELPSVRELKRQYQTSISTILNGYEHLVMLRLVESIPKSGYYVSTQPGLPLKESKGTRSPVVRDPLFAYNLAQTTAVKSGKKSAAFNVTAPGDLLIPQKLILRTMQQVIREKGASLLRYYPPNGSAALRSSIVKRAAYYQTRLRPEELIITDGALQALYIALATICASGDIVAIESPCVFSILEVVRMLNLKVIAGYARLTSKGKRPACLDLKRAIRLADFGLLKKHADPAIRQSLFDKCIAVCRSFEAVWINDYPENSLLNFFENQGFLREGELCRHDELPLQTVCLIKHQG